MLCGLLHGQVDDKFFFIRMLLEDGFYVGDSSSLEEYHQSISLMQELIEVDSSKEIKGRFENVLLGYKIQFFRITLNPYPYSWLLLRFELQLRVGWYRLSGYNESDFIHFYNKILKHYLSHDRDIHSVIEEWTSQDTLIAGIDFDCLIDAARHKRRLNGRTCMMANARDELLRLTVVGTASEQVALNYFKYQGMSDTYSTWSKRLYRGKYPEVARIKRFRWRRFNTSN